MLPPPARLMRPRRPPGRPRREQRFPPGMSVWPSSGRYSPLTHFTYLSQLAAALAAVTSWEDVTLSSRRIGRPSRAEALASAAILAAFEAAREVQSAASYGSASRQVGSRASPSLAQPPQPPPPPPRPPPPPPLPPPPPPAAAPAEAREVRGSGGGGGEGGGATSAPPSGEWGGRQPRGVSGAPPPLVGGSPVVAAAEVRAGGCGGGDDATSAPPSGERGGRQPPGGRGTPPLLAGSAPVSAVTSTVSVGAGKGHAGAGGRGKACGY